MTATGAAHLAVVLAGLALCTTPATAQTNTPTPTFSISVTEASENVHQVGTTS